MIFKDWDTKTFPFKLLTIFEVIIAVTIIILSLIQVFDIWDKAGRVALLLMFALISIQRIENARANKKRALISLIIAIVLFIVAIILLIYFDKLQYIL